MVNTTTTINCDTESVNDWVTEHVQGGRCTDFSNIAGGVELCRQYEQYSDPLECLALSQQPSFNLNSGGMDPSPAEQCLFFG